VTQMIEEKNKAFVLEAFETLFNKRDYVAAERFWAPNNIQHSAHIPPGREGLFNMIKRLPDGFRYENGLTVANGEYVMLHGRFSCRWTGSWRISCVWRMANWPSTGTSSRTKRKRSRPPVACPCSETSFLAEIGKNPRDARLRTRRRGWVTAMTWHSSNTSLASGVQIIGDARADATAVNNANEGIGRRERPQDRNECYASLEGRPSPILMCRARNSRKTRIRIGKSPPCPR
jgi:predicted SnoaL-like aldol condensation-catalyzing enzyme